MTAEIPIRRLYGLQYLRAIAAIMVVGYHLEGQLPESPSSMCRLILDSVHLSAGVDLFFVLSGFILIVSNRDTPAGPFLIQRLIRIVPLYWVLTTLEALLIVLAPQWFRYATLDTTALLKSLLFIPYANPSQTGAVVPLLVPGWSLNCEIAFYGLFAILLLMPQRVWWVTSSLVLGTVVLANSYLNDPINHPALWLWGDLRSFEFLIGLGIGQLYNRGSLRLHPTIAAALLAAGLITVLASREIAQWLQWHTPGLRLITMSAAGVMITGIAALEQSRPISHVPALALLGDASYSLYLTHGFALGAGRVAWKHLTPIQGETISAFLTATLFALTIALALVTYFLLEKPLLRFLRARLTPPDSRIYQPAALCLLVFLFTAPGISQGHDLPAAPTPREPLSDRFTVTAAGRNVPVYIATVRAAAPQLPPEPAAPIDGTASFASFDLPSAGPVTLIVTSRHRIHSAKLLPSRYEVIPQIRNRTVALTVRKPGQLTLEVNGDWNNSLHLFVNPPQTDIPNPADPNVIYFGPGVHVIAPLRVGSGKRVYISDGAIVYGKLPAGHKHGPVISLEGHDITLSGRGIVDASLFPKPTGWGNIIGVRGSHIKVEGIILRDAPTWTLPIWQSDDIQVTNVKVFGWRGNSDGIDIVNSRDVVVSDGFIRTYDDLVVVKALNPGAPTSRNIRVERMVLWNELAHPLSLGAELRTDVEHVLFSDCDLIHDKGIGWALRVFNSDAGTVRDVAFEDIRMEEVRRPWSLWIGHTRWSQDSERGHIEDITFRRIHSTAPDRPDRTTELVGFDTQHAIRNVLFDQVSLGNRPLKAVDIEQNPYVSNARVIP